MSEIYSQMGLKPPVTLLKPSTQKNCKVETSASSAAPTQGTTTSIENSGIPETSTAKRPKSPSIDMFGPPTKEKSEICTCAASDIPAQHDPSIEPRLKSPPIALFDPSIQKNYELRFDTTSDILSHYDSDSDVQTVILCDSPSDKEPNTLHTSVSTEEGRSVRSSGLFDESSDESSSGSTSNLGSSSSDSDIQTVILCDSPSDKEPNTLHTSISTEEGRSAVSSGLFDDSSDDSSSGSTGSSVSPSSDSSGAFSMASCDTKPESPPIALFDQSTQASCEPKAITTSDKSDQYESDSDIQTIILCDNTSENDPDTLNVPTASHEEPSTISDTLSDNVADDSSESSSWRSNSPVGSKSDSSSIDSFDTSSQHDSESEEDEEDLTPRGSQSVAAYASPIQDGRRVRTSCDSIYDLGRWHVDPDGFINEKYRAGGPYLCPLPVTILDLKGSSPLWTVLETFSLSRMINSVLEQYKINASSMKIKKCEPDHSLEILIEPVATLIITATRDTFSHAWVQACRQIWKNLSDNQLGHINVEISDPIIHDPFRVLPMGPQDRIHSIHSAVIQRIEYEVDLRDCLSYGAMRIGRPENTKDSEVVMFLTVDFNSERDWRGPRDQIVSILEDFKLPMVGVMIRKGRMWGASLGLPKRRKKTR
jgi:hypothetical protein